MQVKKILTLSSATAASLGTLLGKLTFLSSLVPLGRQHTRPLQQNLKGHFDFSWKNRHQVISISPQVEEVLLWWSSLQKLQRGMTLQTPSTKAHVTLITDACTTGWGANLGSQANPLALAAR